MTIKSNRESKRTPIVRNKHEGAALKAQANLVTTFDTLVVGDYQGDLGALIFLVENGPAKFANNAFVDVTLHNKDTTPTPGDVSGVIRYFGKTDTTNDTTYVELYGAMAVVTDGAQTGEFIVLAKEGAANKFPIKARGHTVNLAAPTTALADGNMEPSSVTISVDEGADTLTFKVKYSDGTTVKSGTVALA
jgi:hypothetical protein